MKFYGEHAADRDKFEIIAFHDDTAKSIAEIDRKLKEKGIIETYWGGKNLPFPVLVDATRSTINGWGIRAFPTNVLIDPDGKLVKRGSLEMLKTKLPAPPATSTAPATDGKASDGATSAP